MQPPEQNAQSRASLPATPQTFILEPILTPSGIIDAGDDAGDLAIADLSFDIEIPDELPDNFAEFSPEALEANDLPDDLQELPWLDRPDLTTQTSDLFDSGVFTVGETGQVEFDFLFDGGKYKGELGVFSLEGMEQFEPGSEDFIQEAARRALSGSEDGHVVISDRHEGAKFSSDLGEPQDWNTGEYWEDKPAFTMRLGDRFGLIFVPNGSMEQVWENPDIGGSKAPLFSMSTANPDDFFHMGQIADVTAEGHTFVLEDMQISAGSDGDYNDFVFQVRGATSDSPSLEDLAANHHWDGSEIGQEILDYTDQSIAEYEALIEQQTKQILSDIDAALEEFLPDEPAADVEAIPEADIEAALEAEVQNLTEELTATSDRLISDLEPTIGDADATFETLSEQAIAALEQTLAQSNEAETDAIAELAKTYQFAPENQPIVGILDTGFAANNPDINSDNLILGQDFIEGDSNPLVESGSASKHGTTILETIAAIQDNDLGQDGINDDVRLWLSRSTGSGRWAEALVEFVDAAKQSGQPNAIANLSFDLIQIDAEGNASTRLELMADERAALEYARANNALVVAAAGNNNGAMSALGQASSEFENLITVGAAEGGDRADYSSYGSGLDLLAPGQATTGESGSSIAAAKVSGIASLAWAANPELSAAEIADILTATATDLDSLGWDATTGLGLVDLAAAVTAAKIAIPAKVNPELVDVLRPTFAASNSTASERPALWPSRFAPVQQRLNDALNRAKQRAAEAFRNKLNAAASRLASAGKQTVNNFVSRVRNTFSSATSAVRQGISRVTQPIRSGWNRISSTIERGISIIQRLPQTLQDLGERIRSLGQITYGLTDVPAGRHVYDRQGNTDYRFKLDNTGNVAVALRETNLNLGDFQFELYRDLGNGSLKKVIPSPSNPNDDFFAFNSLPKGDYVAKTKVDLGKTLYPYKIVFNLDESEGSREKARHLGKVGGQRITVRDHVGIPGGDRDYYKFTVGSVPRILQYAVRHEKDDDQVTRKLDGNVRITLFDENGQVIKASNSQAKNPTYDSQILDANREYYVSVEALSGEATNYTLVLNAEEAVPIQVPAGRHEYNIIGSSRYRFDLGNAGGLALALRDTDLTSSDFDLNLYRDFGGGNLQIVRPNATNPDDNFFGFDNLLKGTYQVEVNVDPSQESLPYDIIFNLDEAGSSRTSARDLGNLGGERVILKDHVGIPGADLDYYKFSTDSSSRILQYAVRHELDDDAVTRKLDGNVQVTLYDKNGNVIHQENSQDCSSTYNSQVLEPDSEYYVSIKAQNFEATNYSLVLNLSESQTISSPLPTSASQAEPFFKLQFTHSIYNPGGPSSSSNCGPASLAMIMDLLGKEPPGLSIETSIDHARYLMKPNDPDVTTREGVKVLNEDGENTYLSELKTGIANLGKQAVDINSWGDIDRFLAEGKPLITRGRYDHNWRQQFLDYSATGTGDIAHFNTILGKTSTGKYIVADPMYRKGPVEMTKEQLSVFFEYGIQVLAVA